MALDIDIASVEDRDQLLGLYFAIYGREYPYPMCTDPKAMAAAIESKDTLWLVTRDSSTKQVVASAIFEIERFPRIGKLTGVVVDSSYRMHGLAHKMIEEGCQQLLKGKDPLNSIYATTRTVSVGPQLMCMKAGFRAFGIFPNAHRLKKFETTTLLIRYRDGFLDSRPDDITALQQIQPIAQIAQTSLGIERTVQVRDEITFEDPEKGSLEFEIIQAPSFVARRFDEHIQNDYDRFYPFHSPNTMAISKDGEIEIFAYIGATNGYCAIISISHPIHELRGRLGSLLNGMGRFGISYVEALVAIDRHESLQTLMNRQFLPSAIYPAMLEVDGVAKDFIVLSRSLEPLNFYGMAIERQFKPYIDQYIQQWKFAHLECIEVFDDYK